MPETPDNREYGQTHGSLDVTASESPEEVYFKAGFFDPPCAPGQIAKVGKYALIRKLGEGGMGVVYLAHHLESGEQVALKTLNPEKACSLKAATEFLNEARVMEGLKHRYITPILDVSPRPEQPYFVMPYYQRTLESLLGDRCALPPKTVVRFGVQIATALACAHQANVMHGDIKPSNVLLDDVDSEARLADFGLARDFSSNAGVGDVRNRCRKGTVPYMSPLMAQGKGEGLASDIYMFGATMYELLTGYPPYDGDSREEILRKILTKPPEPILSLRPDARPALVHIIERAMERDQDKRYSTMGAVLRDLNKLADIQPWYRWRPSIRVIGRQRKALVMLVAIVASVVAASVLWLCTNDFRAGAARGLDVVRSFQMPGIRSWSGALAGDWDGDGATDLYVMKDNTLTVVSADGEALSEHQLGIPSQVRASLSFVGDVNGDGRDAAFLNWSLDGDMFIDVIGPSRFGMMQFKAKGTALEDSTGARHTTSLGPIGLYDLDGDGRRELLAGLGAGFQRKPRGVCCFNLGNQEMMWQYLTAPTPESVTVGDVTGDGRVEIAVGSHSLANGAVLNNGTDDAHAYLYLLDHRGSPLWLRQFGEHFTHVIPFMVDLDGDGRLALIALVSAGPEYRPLDGERGCVYRVDKDGRPVASYDAGVMLQGLRIVRPVQGSGAQLVVVDRLGRVCLLDKDLSLRSRVELRRQPNRDMDVQIQAVEDLDGDGRPEIVLSTYEREPRVLNVTGEGTVTFTHNHTVIVLNADLSERARYELYKTRKSFNGLRVITADVDHDGRREMILLADEVTVLRVR